jgi:hypothetical protein
MIRTKRSGDVPQVVEHLPHKYEALYSKLSNSKKKRKKKKKEENIRIGVERRRVALYNLDKTTIKQMKQWAFVRVKKKSRETLLKSPPPTFCNP